MNDVHIHFLVYHDRCTCISWRAGRLAVRVHVGITFRRTKAREQKKSRHSVLHGVPVTYIDTCMHHEQELGTVDTIGERDNCTIAC